MLARSLVVDRVPMHDPAAGDVLRALDPTEHNMERLNAKARGSGRTYLSLVLEGPLARAPLAQALDALTSRHPLLRVRIVRGDDGALFYSPTRGDRDDGTARVPVSYTTVDDLSAWPELVEADMNAGAIASDRGPLFAVAVIAPSGLADGASGTRVLVLLGHHCACDAVSLVALMHELLEQLERPHAVASLADRPLADPFGLALPVPPPALAALGIVPEVELGQGAARYEHARTALLHRTLGEEPTRALRRAATEHGLTLHGVLAAAVLLALAAERAARASAAHRSEARPEALALASAVSLRGQLVPPLSPHDLRMAVDVLVSRIPVAAGARFWELARRAGDDVTGAVASGHALSSYFRTVRRDLADTPPGVPLPLLSNVGRAQLSAQYGPFQVRQLRCAMATHGSFQLAMLVLTFDQRLSMSFYCEMPTVSRAALERFASRVLGTLTSVAAGDEPTAPG